MGLKQLFIPVFAIAFVAATGCASKAGNVALGAAGAGAAYEVENKHEIDQLDKQLSEGKISKDEHDRRVQAIKDRSIVNK